MKENQSPKDKEKERHDRLLGIAFPGSFIRLPANVPSLYSALAKGQSVPLGNPKGLDSIWDGTQEVAIQFFLIHDGKSGMEGHLVELAATLERKAEMIWLSLLPEAPAYNLPLMAAIKAQSQVDLSNPKPFFNLLNYWDDLQAAVKGRDIQLTQDAVLSAPLMHDYLREKTTPDFPKVPYRRLFDPTPIYQPGYETSDSDVFPFAKAMETLENESCVNVSLSDERFFPPFFREFLGFAMRQGKTVALAFENHRVADAMKATVAKGPFKDLFPSMDVCRSDFSLPKEVKRLMAADDALDPESRNARDGFLQAEQDYLSESNKIYSSGFLETGEDSLLGLNKFSYYHSLREFSFALDTSSYAPSDFAKDQAFLTYLKAHPNIRSYPLIHHPLHSFKSINASHAVYDSLMATLKKTRSDLDAFLNKVDEAHGSEWESHALNTVEEYESARKNILLVLRYNGFKPDFFERAKNPNAGVQALLLTDEKNDLDDLFDDLSDSLSDINSLSDPRLKALVKETESKHFFKRHQAQRVLKGMLSDKRNYAHFLETIQAYWEKEKSYQAQLAKAEPILGLIIYAKDGPEKANAALEYIQEYQALLTSHPEYDQTTNPLVKRIFKDFAFREDLRLAIREADLALDTLLDDFRLLTEYFQDSFHERKIPFEELKRRLAFRSLATFDQFKEYLGFLSQADHATVPMKQALEAYDISGKALSNIDNNYFYSLYKSLALKHYREGSLDFSKAYRAIKAYAPKQDIVAAKAALSILKKRVFKAWFNTRLGEEAKETLTLFPHVEKGKFDAKYQDLILTICPFQIVSLDRLPLLGGFSYDYVVFLDSLPFSDDDLKAFVSKGNRVLAFSRNNREDPRLSNYPKVDFDLASLYEGPLDYSVLSEDFLNLFAEGFDENDLEVQTQEESQSPMPYSYIGKDGVRRCVIPTALLGERYAKTMAFGANSMLMALKKAPLVFIPSMPLIVSPKDVVEEADSKAESLT